MSKQEQVIAKSKDPKEVFKDGWSQGFEECKRLLRGENRECFHTIGTAVDEDGCCVSCGQDINFIAINAELQFENARLKESVEESFQEGYEDGYCEGVATDGCVENNDVNAQTLFFAWNRSKAMQALKGKPND